MNHSTTNQSKKQSIDQPTNQTPIKQSNNTSGKRVDNRPTIQAKKNNRTIMHVSTQSFDQTTTDASNQTLNQTINQPVKQRVKQPTKNNQSINRVAKPLIKQSNNKSGNQTMKQSSNQQTDHPTKQTNNKNNQPINESNNQPETIKSINRAYGQQPTNHSININKSFGQLTHQPINRK